MAHLECTRCGTPLAGGAPGEQPCPRCLLGLGLRDEETAETENPEGVGDGASSPPAGTIGHFVLLSRMGQGGAGVVYLAEDRDIPGRQVALKLLRSGGHTPDIEMLRSEASALAALQHPHILVVHEIGSSPSGPYLITEALPGGTLADRIRESPLPLEVALRFARDVADALAAAHGRGIVHRDIKPTNILLTNDDQIKVADFGLALTLPKIDVPFTDQPTVTEDRTPRPAPAGTPGYIAPELLQGAPPDPLADQFAFGITFHEMLTGDKPYEESSWPAAVLSGRLQPADSVPRDLARIVGRCISRDPAERYTRMDQVIAELDGVVRKRDPNRRKVRVAVAGGVLAVIAILTVWQAGRWFRTRRAQDLNTAGIRALEADRRTDALRAFVASHRADPGFLPACVNLGMVASDELAIAYLRECASAFPNSSRVLYNLGRALAINGEAEEAESVLETALSNGPTESLQPIILNELALVLIDRDDAGRALIVLDRIAFPPDDTLEGAFLNKTRGLALFEAGRSDEAAGFFRRALDGPLSGEARGIALIGRGRALENRGDLVSARAAFGEALLGGSDEETEKAARSGLSRIQSALRQSRAVDGAEVD